MGYDRGNPLQIAKTYLIQAATTAPNGVQAPTTTATPSALDQIEFTNNGTVTVYLGFGATAADAKNNSVIPTAGTPQNVYVIQGGASKVYTNATGLYYSAITASGSADVFMSPGGGS